MQKLITHQIGFCEAASCSCSLNLACVFWWWDNNDDGKMQRVHDEQLGPREMHRLQLIYRPWLIQLSAFSPNYITHLITRLIWYYHPLWRLGAFCSRPRNYASTEPLWRPFSAWLMAVYAGQDVKIPQYTRCSSACENAAGMTNDHLTKWP